MGFWRSGSMKITFDKYSKYPNWYTWSFSVRYFRTALSAEKDVKEFLSRFKSVKTMTGDYFYFKFANKADEAHFLLLTSDGIEI
jgi:hypothetical protein